MQGLRLRQRECVLCGDAIEGKGRLDRIYCSASCRTLAWRARTGRRCGGRAHSSVPQPGDYLPRGALTQFALRLEAELVAARRRIAALDGPGDLAEPKEPHVQAPIDNDGQEVSDLRAELTRTRTALAAAEARAAALDAEAAEHLDDWVELNQQRSAAEAAHRTLARELEDLRTQLADITEQNRQLQKDAEQASHEPSTVAARIAALEAAHQQALSAKQTSIDELTQKTVTLKQQLETAQAAQQRLSQDRARLSRELQSSADRQAEAQRVLGETQAEVDRLRAENQQLRAQLPESDPLFFLMKTKVHLWHKLALIEAETGCNVKGRRLPSEDPRTVREAIAYATYEARKEFHAQKLRTSKRVSWVVPDRLLDPQSEEELRQEQQSAVQKLQDDLAYTRHFR